MDERIEIESKNDVSGSGHAGSIDFADSEQGVGERNCGSGYRYAESITSISVETSDTRYEPLLQYEVVIA